MIYHEIMNIMYQFLFQGSGMSETEQLTLEIVSAFLSVAVFCLPFIMIWWVIKRFL